MVDGLILMPLRAMLMQNYELLFKNHHDLLKMTTEGGVAGVSDGVPPLSCRRCSADRRPRGCPVLGWRGW